MAESKNRLEQRWCVTEPKIASVSYTWTIKNFGFYMMDNVDFDYLESTHFSSVHVDNVKWCLHLYPTGYPYCDESTGFVSIYVRPMVTENTEDVTASYKLSILTKSGTKTCLKRARAATHSHSSPTRGWPKFVKRDDLKNRALDLLPNDTLTILFDINLMVESFTSYDDNPTEKIPKCSLSNDLSELLASGSFSDVTLVASGKKFNVHKNILSARSSVFAAMFSIEMREKNAAVVPLHDIDPEILDALLSFVYSGETVALTSVNHACKLLEAADKYALDRLKKMCETMICSKISVENVSQLLAFANSHNADQLEKKATRFMQIHISEIQKTDGWHLLFHNHQYQLPREELPDIVSRTRTNS